MYATATIASYIYIVVYNYVGVLSVASAITALHYQDVLTMNSSYLIPFLFGETETGT